jgi:hypothetical protein
MNNQTFLPGTVVWVALIIQTLREFLTKHFTFFYVFTKGPFCFYCTTRITLYVLKEDFLIQI